MGSITTADKAVSTEEDPDYGNGDGGAINDGERLFQPEEEGNEKRRLDERYHNTCFEVAQLQAVLNQLVENKVEAIKQESATLASKHQHQRKFFLMRIIRSSGAIVRRMKRRKRTASTSSVEGGHVGAGVTGTSSDVREKRSKTVDKKRRKELRQREDRDADYGRRHGRGHRPRRGNRQRIASSRSESPRYNADMMAHLDHGVNGTTSHQQSDEDIVFIPCDTPCCCGDTDGHTTIHADSVFDSDYISVKIDDDEDDEDDEDLDHVLNAAGPPTGPLPSHIHHHSHHQHLPHNPGLILHPQHQYGHHYHQSSRRHSVDIIPSSGVAVVGPPVVSGNCLDDEEDHMKKAARLERRHRRRRRRRKKRRREEEEMGHAGHGSNGHLPAHLSAVAVRVLDPDELSKKARLTIAATACLLLFMCLLLVGVTLRMAPLIDEMVLRKSARSRPRSHRVSKSKTD